MYLEGTSRMINRQLVRYLTGDCNSTKICRLYKCTGIFCIREYDIFPSIDIFRKERKLDKDRLEYSMEYSM